MEIIWILACVATKAANQRRREEERRTVKKKKMRKKERVDLYIGRPGGGVKGQ